MSDIFRIHYKPLDDFQKDRIETIKRRAIELHEAMTSYPQSSDSAHYTDLAINDLESSVMWAIKALTT